MKEHEFTQVIRQILHEQFSEAHQDILQQSPILQYLNYKTISASPLVAQKPGGHLAICMRFMCLWKTMSNAAIINQAITATQKEPNILNFLPDSDNYHSEVNCKIMR